METEEQVLALLMRVERDPEQPAPGGANAAEIAALARTLDIRLPDELVAWLAVCRGEAIGRGGVYGIRPDCDFLNIVDRLAPRPGWLERGWLPVAGDGFGNEYVLLTIGPLAGLVAFVEAVTDPDRIDYLVASGLWRFLRFLFEDDLGRRGWPFDRELVLAEDPDLAKAPPELIPWNL